MHIAPSPMYQQHMVSMSGVWLCVYCVCINPFPPNRVVSDPIRGR